MSHVQFRTICRVSYKSYKSSYIPKKKPPENQKRLPPTWHIFAVQHHMLNHHGNKNQQSLPTSQETQPSSNQSSTSAEPLKRGTAMPGSNSSLTDHRTIESENDSTENLNEVGRSIENDETTHHRTDIIEEVASQSLIYKRSQRKRIIPNFGNNVNTKKKRT